MKWPRNGIENDRSSRRGRRLGSLLGLDHLEVLWMETDRLTRRRAGDGVEHRALHRELAVVAEAPRPGGAGRFGEPAGVTGLVGPSPIPLQLLEDLRERARPACEPPAV